MTGMKTASTVAPGNSEARDGMWIDWDVPVPMDDGVTLRANVFRPAAQGTWPVILTMGPYGKDLPMEIGYPSQWALLVADYPDALSNTTAMYMSWELVDPEKWTRDGYVCVRIDSRGAARSPGFMNCFSFREIKDLYDCIEWAAEQDWSTGKVGLNGTSYHAVNAWQVSSSGSPPPHLAAICAWEGTNDWYRECAYHGGIPCNFLSKWFPAQVEHIQHGNGAGGYRNPVSGLLVGGDEQLTDEERRANRADIVQELLDHPFDGPYWRERSAQLDKITVPFLSAANWGSHGLHLRGNLNAFLEAPVADKWLEVHGREHFPLFYTDYGRTLQRRFFDWFLKGEGDWTESQPRVLLQVRHPDGSFTPRSENEWPLARTEWTELHLDATEMSLSRTSPWKSASAEYDPMGDGLTFKTSPLDTDIEITGPLACRLWISSATSDADLFLVVRAFDPEGQELLYRGMNDPYAPLAQGWLRASHRAIDEARSRFAQPFHPHDRADPLEPGERYALDIEIWPTCATLPAGYTLALTVIGHDFDHGLELSGSFFGSELRGSGIWQHPDRPHDVYGGTVTVHTGPGRESYLLVPFIPVARQERESDVPAG